MLEKIESWRMWVLCDREPIRDWSRGRVTLLGYLAQGACMAIEGGVLATRVAANNGDFETAREGASGGLQRVAAPRRAPQNAGFNSQPASLEGPPGPQFGGDATGVPSGTPPPWH